MCVRTHIIGLELGSWTSRRGRLDARAGWLARAGWSARAAQAGRPGPRRLVGRTAVGWGRARAGLPGWTRPPSGWTRAAKSGCRAAGTADAKVGGMAARLVVLVSGA